MRPSMPLMLIGLVALAADVRATPPPLPLGNSRLIATSIAIDRRTATINARFENQSESPTRFYVWPDAPNEVRVLSAAAPGCAACTAEVIENGRTVITGEELLQGESIDMRIVLQNVGSGPTFVCIRSSAQMFHEGTPYDNEIGVAIPGK